MLGANINWVEPSQAYRATLVALLGAGIALLLARLITGSWERGALLATVAILLFSSYGHIYGSLERLDLGLPIGRHRYLLPLWMLIFTAALLAIRRNKPAAWWQSLLTAVALGALALPLFTIARETLLRSKAAPVLSAEAPMLQWPGDAQTKPDIYYIILDAYAREDVLRAVYDYDNHPFIEALRQRGFYVPDQAHANYAQTALSLGSSLNLDYIQTLFPGMSEEATSRSQLWEALQHSEVRRLLEGAGYTTVAFSTGLAGTDIQDADLYFSAGAVDRAFSLSGLSDFETMLIHTSAGILLSDAAILLPNVFPDLSYPYNVHRARILNIFEHLPHVASLPEPTFTFAHVIAPHAPFVFDAEGRPRTPKEPFSLGFTLGGEAPKDPQDYVHQYRDQLAYVNMLLLKAVDEILARSDTPPIILLQADHGPKSGLGRLPYTSERMAIFAAYYLPPGVDPGLYPSLSPVNSFRLVFNSVFGTHYAQLPDISYYSEYRRPFHFTTIEMESLP